MTARAHDLSRPRDLLAACESARADVRAFVDAAVARARALTHGKDGRVDEDQRALHALAWWATYAAALDALWGWAHALDQAGAFGDAEQLIVRIGFGEYLNQLVGGIPISQAEMVRPGDLGLAAQAAALAATTAPAVFMSEGNTAPARAALRACIEAGRLGNPLHGDEALSLFAHQIRRFVDQKVSSPAHDWHRKNDYIPLEIVHELGELGVFGLTVPEQWGGSGLGKLAMSVASEELSRGYIGVGSLGTRAEIAGELIRLAGTPAQRERYLPGIAAGALLPTAVFTEPNSGSDLASITARAELTSNSDGRRVWKVTGNKTWITHAARADLMTMLVRTTPDSSDHRGLSILLIEKTRGDDANPFPNPGLSGGEIEVLGYRGMKEYELRFEGLETPEANLLGGVPGLGFKQLMQTFESARIQTAARAVGVAQNALELGLSYALERRQFAKTLINFPRVADKLALMLVETMAARQLTYAAAREKDKDNRCDIEAGMAKLLAARVAWSNADCALQIHGGNGFALEFAISRVLCDARILNIFEGAAEIQAHVIARGLLKT